MGKFDVFLSYKYSDASGNKTKDALMAEELYEALNSRNIKTFYSNRTIGMLAESEYKRAIDDALDQVQFLVAVGTSKDNLNSNWVKYEWDGFQIDLLTGRKKGEIISFIDDMEVKDLPRSLSAHQSFVRGTNSIDEICDFVCNYLKRKPKLKLCPPNCKVLSLSVLKGYGLSALEAENAFNENDKFLYKDMPDEISGDTEQWAKIVDRYSDFCAAVVDDDLNIYGNYSIAGLNKEQEHLISEGKLIDSEISVNTADNLYMPGTHVGYLLNISVNPSSESSDIYQKLWNHMISTLKRVSKEKVYFSKIYFKAFAPEYEAKVASRGFRFICNDQLYGSVYVLDLMDFSTLKVLDEELATIYQNAFPAKTSVINASSLTLVKDQDALIAYLDLWKQIEDLFYQPEYYRLKKYFMSGKGIPENTVEYKIGLAVSEWIRDILQYTEALLPFIPDSQKASYEKLKNNFYESEIVRDSMKQYQFSTEDENNKTELDGPLSIKALLTFTQIWLDIDKLFMRPELLDYKQYFYEKNNELPSNEDIEVCEALTVRIISVFKISELQLKQLPFAYSESYYNYKNMICKSEIARYVFGKYPFLKDELNIS